ncbi:iso-IS1 ORF1 [Klebsiella pneumoniae]|nr:iso-IS1 ORF1 [Klebsiella pneumoniae]SWW79623.1 iso-IS1 ORF1 [Klebsiella pneumoniae]VGH98347.1 iso-IS1 ORF1 [Klebsiella pneumoniae]
MASVNIHCPRCQSAQVYRHGQNPKGHDRFRCRDCHRVFQLTYTYEARKPGIKELITEMAFNGAGVRDTARTLKIGRDADLVVMVDCQIPSDDLIVHFF